uniref:Interleukin-31 n=1 Tax=Monodon monoceros TaxID=40151 RepID=A0A8C6F368_MONMO
MVSHAGSARFALFLLCHSGALLSSHTAPYVLGPDKQQAIIKELRSSFEKLLNDYQQEESGVPESSQYQTPCFALNPQLPYSIDSSATLPYCRAIKPFFDNKAQVVAVIDHLSKLEFRHEPETKVSVPTDSFKCKSFKKVFRVPDLFKSLNTGAQ